MGIRETWREARDQSRRECHIADQGPWPKSDDPLGVDPVS